MAGVTLDGTMGPAGALTGPNYAIKASQGQTAGANLFHSFSAFGLTSGEAATFSNDTAAAISNVISRVTGGSPSNIDGTIRSTITGANLYLINPAGILFGRNAALDVSGSFYASTASYLKFADGVRFDTTSPGGTQISAASPSAFGFPGFSAAAISIQGATFEVPAGKTIGLVGGDVTLENQTSAATMRAKGGAIVIGSARSPGEAALAASSIEMSAFGAQGTINVAGGSTLDVSDTATTTGGGRIFVRGGRIVLENATLDAQTRIGSSQGIDLSATESFSQSGGSVTTVTTGAGNAGSIRINAPVVAFSNGSLVDSSCDPGCTTGHGGPISVSAGSMTISGTPTSALATAIVSNTLGDGDAGALSLSADFISATDNAIVQSVSAAGGRAGSVTVSGSQVELRGGAQIDSSTHGSGAAGAVSVTGTASVIASGAYRGGATPIPSGIFSNTRSSGNAGTVRVQAGALVVESGGEISSSSQGGASGTGGVVSINARTVNVTGSDDPGARGGIATNALGRGNAGAIEITAASMQVASGGRVQSQSQGAGKAGDIVLDLGSLSLASGGQLSADARSSGAGGTIKVSAGNVSAAGTDSLGKPSGVFAQTYTSAPGGSIHIDAGAVEIRDGGAISARSSGIGIAGDIRLNAGASLKIERGEILTEARFSDGGNVSIAARDLIYLNDGNITTKVGFGFGNGGNIQIDPVLMVLSGSSIIADAFGGNGGNITITAQNFFMSPESVVRASSQLGISGAIQISSPVIDLSGNLAVLAPGFLDAAALLASRCAARFAGKASSLVLAGRGGLPPAPDGLIPVSALSPLASPAVGELPLAVGAQNFSAFAPMAPGGQACL